MGDMGYLEVTVALLRFVEQRSTTVARSGTTPDYTVLDLPGDGVRRPS